MIVVAGWPRTGTSLLMNMLSVGGYPVLQDDGVPLGHPANPNGFFEFRRGFWSLDGLLEGDFAVKIFYGSLLRELDSGFIPEKVLMTSRSLMDVLNSLASAFGHSLDPNQMESNRLAVRQRLEERNIPILDVAFNDVVNNPAEQVNRISEFVGGSLDVAAMAAVPDINQRHFYSGV